MKRFNGVCLVTNNLPRLRDFYCDLLQSGAEGDDTFVTILCDGAVFAIYTTTGMEGMAPGSTSSSDHGGLTLEFEVEDVDQEYERLLERDIPIVKPPTTQPWGRRSVWFRDPDGNIINFFSALLKQ